MNLKEENRLHDSLYQCDEYTVLLSRPTFFCNAFERGNEGESTTCHKVYHHKNHFIEVPTNNTRSNDTVKCSRYWYCSRKID